jgi:16S rRNA (uracil1498-N3)-methyltransferase
VAPSAPDPELRAACALVFVEDLASPELCQDDDHHLGEVLRLKPGELVAAGDGSGSWRICTFAGVQRASEKRSAKRSKDAGHCGLEIAGAIRSTTRLSPVLEIGLCWAKSERTEWAVAKLAELGVDRVTPVVADRSVVRPDEQAATRRRARLSKIAREAAMQSRRLFLPEIGEAESLDAFVARRTPSPIALAEPGGDVISLATPSVAIGPEGGWSERELALVDTKVCLGNGVLRIETAAVAAGVLLTAMRTSAPVAPS